MCEPNLDPPIERTQCKGCGCDLSEYDVSFGGPDVEVEYCKWCIGDEE
jgi:hypothetical protein